MARINKNLLVRGARGNVGKQFVYKKRGKNTHIAVMPEIDENRPVTAAQTTVRELFAAAALYAKGAISNPGLKKEYAKVASPGNTAYNMAFRDYIKSPVVKSIDVSNYTGAVGSVIMVKAKDDFRVASVTVSIYDASRALVEEGEAVLNPLDLNKWIYTAMTSNVPAVGSTISAIARDVPGNQATLEITV